jgi:hypothetical protein
VNRKKERKDRERKVNRKKARGNREGEQEKRREGKGKVNKK